MGLDRRLGQERVAGADQADGGDQVFGGDVLEEEPAGPGGQRRVHQVVEVGGGQDDHAGRVGRAGQDAAGRLQAVLNSLTGVLTLMLVAVAGLGVLSGVVLDTRERVRDLGIHKALGMTPRQTVVMVVTSVVMTGLVGGAVGVPLGVALHGWIMPAMGHSAGPNLPESVIAVYRTPELVLLALGGLLIAVLGALLPAG